MAYIEIPTNNEIPAYNQIVKLDEVNYQISLYFNPRMNNGVGKWMITLGDQLGNIICGPVPVVATWPLFNRFKAAAIPPGTIFCFDSSNQNQDPGQFELGDRCRLFYLEAGT